MDGWIHGYKYTFTWKIHHNFVSVKIEMNDGKAEMSWYISILTYVVESGEKRGENNWANDTVHIGCLTVLPVLMYNVHSSDSMH